MAYRVRRPEGKNTVLESDAFAEDFRHEPYWWTAAPPTDGYEEASFKGTAEIAVVGSGFTGMVAALNLARAGADVIVLDSQRIGEGACRRNAGFMTRTCKRSLSSLTAQYGQEYAIRVYREYDEALNGLYSIVDQERIDCFKTISGRFVAANSKGHFDALVKECELNRKLIGTEFSVVQKNEVHTEMATDEYVGGVVIPNLGSYHPGLYHQGLVDRAISAGVRLAAHTEVLGISDGGRGKILSTSRGDLTARQVIFATNGYTTKSNSWLSRRVIPFRGFVMATETLPTETIDKVLPQRRTYNDSRLNVEWCRPAPDSSRIIFGGMTGSALDMWTVAQQTRQRFMRRFPDLKGVRLSRAWTGQCAGTFDFLPHIGKKDGVHYALGYNYMGMAMATRFGQKLAARVLGQPDPESAFEVKPFPTLPFYNGVPWFVPLGMRFYDWRDNRVARK